VIDLLGNTDRADGGSCSMLQRSPELQSPKIVQPVL